MYTECRYTEDHLQPEDPITLFDDKLKIVEIR